MGHEVAVLQHGRLMQVADPVTLYRHPATVELARFVGEAVLLPGVAKDGYVTCALGCLRLVPETAEGQVEVLVRPEQIQLSSATGPGVPARVAQVTFYGHDASVTVQVSNQGRSEAIIARVAGYASPAVGVDVTISVAGEVVAFPLEAAVAAGAELVDGPVSSS